MHRRHAIFAMVFASSLFARGRTVKITIQGGHLPKPLVLTGDKVAEFDVWAGPGNFRNRIEESVGFIIEWEKGVVAKPPRTLQVYEVAFYLTTEGPPEKSSIGYVVKYGIDRGSNEGLVYLYDVNEPAYVNNRVLRGHGYEGKWMHATQAWSDYVNPLLAKSR